jgi:hypothetical protein
VDNGSADGSKWAVLPCSSLKGFGTLGDPYQLGTVIGPLELSNCLTPAASAAADVDYAFTMPRHPGPGAWAGGSAFDGGAAHAAILTPQGAVLLALPTPPPPPPGQGEVISSECSSWPLTMNDIMPCSIDTLGSGSYILQEDTTAPNFPTRAEYDVWISPNYSGAQTALWPANP